MDETTATSRPIPMDGRTPIDATPSPAATATTTMGTWCPTWRPTRCPGDALALGVVLLLVSSVLQRVVGFVREICFCRWLSPEELGQWDMAFGFLMLAGPLLVMSLPGTFARYLDRYQRAGQMRSFLRRTAGFCAVLSVPSLLAILAFRGWISYLVFGSRGHECLVVLLACGLLVIIAFNFLLSLVMALRSMKVMSVFNLANSVLFGVLGIGLLCCGQNTAGAMVAAYVASCLLCVLGVLPWLAGIWRGLPQDAAHMPHRELWSRMLPLAGWMMVVNLLWSLFDVVDRYMIIHLLPGSAGEALAEVGNYRSSRVLPLLLSSITAMIAAALLPHLSHDWEAGRRRQVSDRLNFFLKIWAILLTAAGAAVMFIAPELFRIGFQSKFPGGLLVLPWTLTYFTWFALSMFLQQYLWCAERAGASSIVALLGVLVNVALNLLLLPRMGLKGAVLATAAANGVALLLMVALSSRYGFRVHRGTLTALLLPGCIPLGPWVVLLMLAAVTAEIIVTDRYLTREEKQEIWSGLGPYLGKLRPRPRRAEAV
jgi:O-antigen/teichoic acid export membrane protein